MKISELARRTGVPVATIKYYLRENLLQPGERTSATQAAYDDSHEQRLRLIRALVEVGNLPLATVRRVLATVDDEHTNVHHLLGITHHALGPDVQQNHRDAEWSTARADVDAFLTELGWMVHQDAPARDLLAKAVLALRGLGLPDSSDDLRPYARAAHELAKHELASTPRTGPRSAVVEHAVLGTVLYEPVLIALRRLAEEHESAQLFTDPA